MSPLISSWIRTSCLSLLGLITPLQSLAGGYMLSGGETQYRVGLKMDFGDHYFDKSGERTGGDCGTGLSMPLAVEHGWSYYTNVFANTALRFKDCPGERQFSLGDTEIGLRRRVNPLDNGLVWEATLILPTSRIGDTRNSDAAEFGLELGLHRRQRPDPYRLDLDRDPLAGHWDYGTSLRAWAAHLPLEWRAYLAYSRPLGLTNFGLGQRAWSFSADLDWRQSIARTHPESPAVDNHDDFHILNLSLYFGYPLARFERLGISLQKSLLGENRDDSSGISVTYGKTFR